MFTAIHRSLMIAPLVAVAGSVWATPVEGNDPLELAAAGKALFFDASLSNPPGVSCMSCHQPEAAFADVRAVSPGAVAGRAGRRNSTSLMYAALIPNMDQEDMLDEAGTQEWVWQGGLILLQQTNHSKPQ